MPKVPETSATSIVRAAELREQIDLLSKKDSALEEKIENKEELHSATGEESPREFVQRRMRELQVKP